LADSPSTDSLHRPTLQALVISPNYFHALNLSMLQGRAFSETDGVAGPPAAIVNQRFAEKIWPGQNPVGKRLRLVPGATPEPWLNVVGVAPNIEQNDITPREIDPLVYLPYRQKPQADMAIVARTLVPPGTLGSAFRREIQAIDADLP